jgi:phage-related protein
VEIRFYQTVSGRNPVLEFVRSLSSDVQKEFSQAISLLEKGEQLAMPLSRSLASIHPGLHELRLRDSGGIYRVFYFIKVRHAVYMLHALKKKTREIPPKEIKIILRRIREV